MGKRIVKVSTLLILLIILVYKASIIYPSNDIEGENMMNPQLQFNKNGQFKIMVIADIQSSLPLSKYTLELIINALDQEHPDLVVFAGDNICDFAPRLLFNKNNVKELISTFLAPVVRRNIPFCVIFGNHDAGGVMSKSEQMKYFMTFPNSYSQMGVIKDRVGNYNLLIKDSNGEENILNLWFFDSGNMTTFSEGIGYAYVNDEQITWYEQEVGKISAGNQEKLVPSMVFQHIAVPEVYNTLISVKKGTDNAVRGHGINKSKYFILNPKNHITGSMEEGPCPPDINNGQFNSWLNQGDIFAAFFGHDHKNDFHVVYEDIDLVFTSGAGFYSYGKGYQHGVRIIEINEKDVVNYKSRMVYFSDVTDTKLPWYLRYIGEQIFITATCVFVLLIMLFLGGGYQLFKKLGLRSILKF